MVTTPIPGPVAQGEASPVSAVEPGRLEVVAHELRTPLSVARIVLDLLAAKPLAQAADVAPLIARLRSSCARLDALTENLATAAAIEAGRAVAHQDLANVARCLEEALGLVEPLLRQRGQTAASAGLEGLPQAAIDPLSLEQILTNLLTNAGKYGPAGDRIDIQAVAVADGIELGITDHGPGVMPADRERIFRPYVRGGSGKGTSGLGLGLYLVRSLAVAHGGKAGVRGAAGAITFWVFLPAVRRTVG